MKITDTLCHNCKKEFDEDSSECFRCNSKKVLYRAIITKKERIVLDKLNATEGKK